MSKSLKTSASFTAIGAAAFNLAVAQREYDITKSTRAGRVASLVEALHAVCSVERAANGGILSVSIAASEQEKAQEIVRRHVVAADLFGKSDVKSLADADDVLAKAVKARTDAETRAYQNANKIWSRLLEHAGLKSTHGNAGNSNAGKGDKAESDEPESDEPEGDKPEGDKPKAAKAVKVAPVMPDVTTRAALLQGVADAIATYMSKGKAMTDVAAADIAAMVAARELIDARLKIKFD